MFFALPWLMVLLILGTVSQRYLGLYASQKLFFGSFVLWVGPLPLPGAYTTLALIAGSLLAKLMLKSSFNEKRVGTLLVHVSALVLLLGGLISDLWREEGYIVLGDGQSSRIISDYRKVELSVTANGNPITAISPADMEQKKSYSFNSLPFQIALLQYCYPCAAVPRTHPEEHLHDAAAAAELKEIMPAPEEPRNLHGAAIRITGAGAAQDGIYMTGDVFAAPAAFIASDKRYTISLSAAQRVMPFTVRLRHFIKSDYPGTDEARAYRSEVAVQDGALEWNTDIEMNRPLRYKGYTLYQSSFVAEQGGAVMSVLAVVKNVGEWFPYIAIGMLCTGLMLHILLLIRSKRS